MTTAYETEASITTELATSTVTSLTPVYTGAPCTYQETYGAIWEGPAGRYQLYCTGTAIQYGFYETSVQTTDMEECLDICAEYSCQGITLSDTECTLYNGNATPLDGASGYRAAIRVQ